MKIEIPSDFDINGALSFCKNLDDIEFVDEYIYDYGKVGNVEPFGMLLIGSKIREFINNRNKSNHVNINCQGKQYAGHMGYFHSIYEDYGKKPGEAPGNDNYIPISCEDIKDSYARVYSSDEFNSIYEFIEAIAEKLANVISRGDKSVKGCLRYCITEIIRNVYEHSNSKELWYAAQYWPSRDLVEIAILDEGNGVANTLKRNKKIAVEGDEVALKLAVQPGVTKSIVSKNSNDEYDNQGFGLYMTNAICERFGSFAICSGNTCLVNQLGKTTKKQTSFKGTAVRMRLHVSKIKEVNQLTTKLSQEGTDKSKKLNSLSSISVDSIKKI